MDTSTKNVVRILSITTVFLLLLFALYKVGWVFGWIAAALLITTLLSPITDFLQNYSFKKNRGIAVAGTFVVVFIIFALLALVVLPPIINEVINLSRSITSWVGETQNSGQIETITYNLRGQAENVNTSSLFNVAKQFYAGASATLGGLFSSVSSGIFATITIITLTFFMLMDTDSVVRGISFYLPKKHQPMFKKLSQELFTLIGKYFAGVLFVGIIAGAFAVLPLSLLRVEYAAALALTVAIFDLVPMVGATIGGSIVVIVCLLSGNVPAAIIMTIYFVAYQQLENNLVIPLVQKQAIKISPMGILIALLIGGALGGMIGTLLAIPAAAFIKIVYQNMKSEGVLGEKAQESVQSE